MDKKKELTILRRLELKKLRNLANQYLSENKQKKGSHKYAWDSIVYENNIKRLKEIISEINKESKDSVIEVYVSNKLLRDQREQSIEKTLSQVADKLRPGIQEFNIIRYSPSFSVIHDLYWIEDGTVGDQKEIALGRRTPEIYEKYLDDKIAKIEKEIYPLLESKEEFIQSLKILKSAISSLKKKNYVTANILIITIIEGLVKLICKKIYSKQNPEITEDKLDKYIYKDFFSIEKLILNGDFKPDYDISLIDGFLLSQHVIEPELDKIEKEFNEFKEKSNWFKEKILQILNQKSSETDMETLIEKLRLIQDKIEEGSRSHDETRKISIKPRLQFLLRSFKEDRNLIIHGKYNDFDKAWKSYIYCSAILKVCDILREYI